MAPERQNEVIAELCGWKRVREDGMYWHPEKKIARIAKGSKLWKLREKMNLPMANVGLPDYLNSLDAMREAEMTLKHPQDIEYADILADFFESIQSLAVFATPAQRAEALLRTLNLWEETNISATTRGNL